MDADREAEPDLPQLPSPPPPSTVPARLGRTPKPPHLYKLHSQDNFAGTSSDPPVFSSDEVPAGSENYATRRKKHTRVGPWWESSSHPRKRRKMEPLNRNIDSGVFMDDAKSLVSSDLLSSELDPAYDTQITKLALATTEATAVTPMTEAFDEDDKKEDDDAASSDDYTRWGPPTDLVNSFYCPGEVPPPSESPVSDGALQDKRTPGQTGDSEDKSTAAKGSDNSRRFRLRLSAPNPDAASYHPALEVVERAVENGVEDIDLSGQFVWNDPALRAHDQHHRLDDRIFHPLHHLVKTRAIHDPDRYDSLVPDMRLWLSSNRLERLPNEIYRLRNLTKLGLRGNKLRTLDPALGRLERLQLLNLTGNRVNYLPWEVKRLSNLTELMTDNGHLYHPLVETKAIEKAQKSGEITRRTFGSLIAVSAISWLDTQGLPLPNSAPRPSMTPVFDPSKTKNTLESAPYRESGRALSMSDICLRTAARSPDLPALLNSPSIKLLPPHLVALLKNALDARQTDGLDCSICSRRFIVPRAEWLEWVIQAFTEVPLPLLRTACSWSCAEEYISKRPPVLESGARGKPKPGTLAAWGCGWTTEHVVQLPDVPSTEPASSFSDGET